MEKYKIVHIIKGDYGGMDFLAKKIFKKYNQKYNQKIFFFENYGKKLYKNYVNKKIFSIKIKNEVVYLNLWFNLKDLFQADIIHIQHTKIWILFSPLCFFWRKNIFSFHINFGVAVKKSFFIRIIISLIISYIALFSKQIICLTIGQQKNLKQYSLLKRKFNKKAVVINNFISKKIIVKEKNNFNNKILFVGRYEKLKGFYDLLKVSKNIIDIEFCFIGGDKIEMEQKNIINYGKIENSQILEYYDKCSIFILPSYTEAFPMTILEAMSRGLVILVSNIPGMNEIIKDGHNGYLFSTGDTKKMKEIIEYLKDNPCEIKRISKNNLKDVQRFTEEKLIKGYEKLYKKVIEENA
ncbi:glycosyltransferase family 4 protein [Candidatus Parcubacteria bacterium]|nr:glycosyltransferase family 4 protein [Candidatus Parcubacteria bacterium]